MVIGYVRERPVEGVICDVDATRLMNAGCDTVYTRHPPFSDYDGWGDMCKDMRPGDTLVLTRKEDIPDMLDFDTLVIVLDMIANSMVMLLDEDNRLHRVIPKVRYGRITTDDI